MSTTDMIIPAKPSGDPNKYDAQTIRSELIKISDPVTGVFYWCNNYVKIYSNDTSSWIPFELWAADCGEYDNQIDFVRKLRDHKRVLGLKARQNGISYSVLAVFLRKLLFEPVQVIGLISRGEIEAIALLKRLRGMYARLPYWCKAKSEESVTKTYWELSNGSSVWSLSPNKSDSWAFSACCVDECDLIHQGNSTSLAQLLLRLEPAAGQNGQMVLISKPDKSRPNSTFKKMFRAAHEGKLEGYVTSFVPWMANPNRTKEWYEIRVKESLARDGSLDAVRENYSATISEALSPPSTDRRLPFDWIQQCYIEEPPMTLPQIRELYDPALFEKHKSVFSIPSLEIFRLPKPNEEYVIGCDTAEGLQSSDYSSLHVLCRTNREEVARISTKCEPSTLAYYAHLVSRMYNRAKVLVERNQHGHAFILWARDNSDMQLLQGMDAKNVNTLSTQKRIGWNTNSVSKSTGYAKVAEALRDEKCIIHSSETFRQLCAIKESSLEAPPGEHDDAATTYMLSISAIDIILNKPFELAFI